MDIEIILEKLEDAKIAQSEISEVYISEYRMGCADGLQQAINIIKLNEKREETK